MNFSVTRFKVRRLVGASRCVLAGALALTLFLFSLLATNGEFHSSLHHSGSAASGSCLLCLFVKGHVSFPETAAVTTTVFRKPFVSAPSVESVVLEGFTYLASPSRAPPVLPSPLPVVA